MPRDERLFITVHDGMPEHPKVEGLSDAAFRVMLELWCWCSRNKTDGAINRASWEKRTRSQRVRDELVSAGLYHLTADGGAAVHDYTEHQRTAAEIAELSEKRREAGKRGGKAKASATANARALAKQTASKSVAETETDTEEEPKNGSSRRASRLPDDWKPTIEDVQWARALGVNDLDQKRWTDRFCRFWQAKSGKDAAKLDWSKTWRNWIDREYEGKPRAKSGSDQWRGGW